MTMIEWYWVSDEYHLWIDTFTIHVGHCLIHPSEPTSPGVTASGAQLKAQMEPIFEGSVHEKNIWKYGITWDPHAIDLGRNSATVSIHINHYSYIPSGNLI